MRCTSCNQELWGVKARECPQCGTGFVPSEFTFAPGAARFGCPHCEQAYTGTGERGELLPRRFGCVRCGRVIDMDEMVVTEAVQVEVLPTTAHPPVRPGTISIAPREAVWPVPIGVIAIVFGTVGVLMGLYGVATPWMASFFSGMTPQAQFDPFAAMRKWQWWLSGLNGVGTLAAIALLIAGIGLLQRRAWAASIMLVWGTVKIVLEVGLAIVTAAMQRDQFQAMSATSGGGMPMAVANSIAVVTLVVAIGFYCALPVFMLIWFLRRPVRDTVAKWRAGETA